MGGEAFVPRPTGIDLMELTRVDGNPPFVDAA
jgi:hypothetical protein